MKESITRLIDDAVALLKNQTVIPKDTEVELKIERTKDSLHGDFSCNVALILAKPCRKAPRKIAEAIVAVLEPHPSIEKVAIAGPGFINFYLKKDASLQVVEQILKQQEAYGHSNFGQGQKIIIEYVSANPTGPLHVGHGRSAAFGASLANILAVSGFKVTREYYVNDAGRQMNILAVSLWLRYLSLTGETVVFPANAYRGDYVTTMAAEFLEKNSANFSKKWSDVSKDLPLDEPEGGDKERYIDALIERAQQVLGRDGFALFHQAALHFVLDDIKNDLHEFGVHYDNWFSEQSLADDGSIEKGVAALQSSNHTFVEKDALWFKSTDFGDEKDRVIVRSNGQPTYFASDVAYHWNKYARGFDRVIDIFGADHHGYLTRIRSAVSALGHDEKALSILLVQFALLFRSGERVQMSTRSGSFVTLRELRQEVGNDAARFFYVMRKPEQHMDFDLDLAVSQSSDNPVYYIQYAHARIHSVLRQLQERNLLWKKEEGLAAVGLLSSPHEKALLTVLARYPEVILAAAQMHEPHQLAYYLRELAQSLHSYYNAVQLLCENLSLRSARLCLLAAVAQVLKNGLHLLGVFAPESM